MYVSKLKNSYLLDPLFSPLYSLLYTQSFSEILRSSGGYPPARVDRERYKKVIRAGLALNEMAGAAWRQ